jgi:pyridoxal phosphate enzyme (YggS family)
MSNDYINNYKKITKLISSYKKKYNKDIKLVVVSKTQDFKKIAELHKNGQNDFGENYVDEAESKIKQINNQTIKWHFIGKIQSNKIKKISEYFSWVHTIDREKHVRKIDAFCSQLDKIMNVCIQINIDNEASKGGIDIDNYANLSNIIQQMKNIKLRGIMAIPNPNKSCSSAFAKMKDLYNSCTYLDTLSMGMSKDYLSAIENDANIIRVGQEIFGERK